MVAPTSVVYQVTMPGSSLQGVNSCVFSCFVAAVFSRRRSANGQPHPGMPNNHRIEGALRERMPTQCLLVANPPGEFFRSQHWFSVAPCGQNRTRTNRSEIFVKLLGRSMMNESPRCKVFSKRAFSSFTPPGTSVL